MAYIQDNSAALLEDREARVLYSVFRALRYMAINEEEEKEDKEQQLTVSLFHRCDFRKVKNTAKIYRRFWDYLEESD